MKPYTVQAMELYKILNPYEDEQTYDSTRLRILELSLEANYWEGYNNGIDKWLEHLKQAERRSDVR